MQDGHENKGRQSTRDGQRATKPEQKAPSGRLVELTRRAFVSGIGALALGGCTASRGHGVRLGLSGEEALRAEFDRLYGPRPNERFPIPAVKRRRLKPAFYRRTVPYETREKPGTIIVDTAAKYLYLVQEKGRAIRYGIGVGRQGFSWSGRAQIGWKRKWPTWTPPAEMIRREPHLAKFAKGMEPGLKNPLGARALYLVQNGRDTLYRIHGTQEAYSIGKAVSSGCIRLINQDVIDLYDRVKVGATVVVLPALAPSQKIAAREVHSHAL